MPQGVCHIVYIFLGYSSGKGITVPSLIIAGYVWQILGRRTFLVPKSVSSPEKAHPKLD